MTTSPMAAAGLKMLRVLVVEDSLTIRKHLAGILQRHGMEIVGEAADGLVAVEMCRTLRPDVVTMDMILPGCSGLAATEQIMAFSPTPILIVSASVNRGEAMQTYDALAAGAVDVFDKQSGGEAGVGGDWEERFVSAVRMTARIKVITHPRARWRVGAGAGLDVAAGAGLESGAAEAVDLVALGASTGGPAAIVQILKGLPADFPVPILAVLHISELFSFAFADWLNSMSPIPARYAVDGEPMPLPGKAQVVLAPAGKHLIVEDRRLRLIKTPERHSCRPSIDVLFESLAAASGLRAMLCLLTGMGKDGAEGLLAARRAGMQTVAQDEATSVIFGMPGEAVRLGAARQVLPIEAIAPLLLVAGTKRLNRAPAGRVSA